jgi:hypothetical protein
LTIKITIANGKTDPSGEKINVHVGDRGHERDQR